MNNYKFKFMQGVLRWVTQRHSSTIFTTCWMHNGNLHVYDVQAIKLINSIIACWNRICINGTGFNMKAYIAFVNYTFPEVRRALARAVYCYAEDYWSLNEIYAGGDICLLLDCVKDCVDELCTAHGVIIKR